MSKVLRLHIIVEAFDALAWKSFYHCNAKAKLSVGNFWVCQERRREMILFLKESKKKRVVAKMQLKNLG